VERIRRLSERGGGPAGRLTTFGSDGYVIAALAAGGCIAAVDAVLDRQVENAYALVRPAGHHAAIKTPPSSQSQSTNGNRSAPTPAESMRSVMALRAGTTLTCHYPRLWTGSVYGCLPTHRHPRGPHLPTTVDPRRLRTRRQHPSLPRRATPRDPRPPHPERWRPSRDLVSQGTGPGLQSPAGPGSGEHPLPATRRDHHLRLLCRNHVGGWIGA
jgi:hypothetical protein